MELAQLRALRELRDRGSIAAVATAFRVTPSAVSQQLAGLQRSVGVPLTRLDGRRTVLTDAGAALADAAVAVESALIDAANSITEFHADAVTQVSVAAFDAAAATLFPRLAAVPQAERPELVLRSAETGLDDVPGLVADTDLVIAQRLAGGADWPAQLAVVPLLVEPLDVAFRAGHRLDGGGRDTAAPASAAELRELRWIAAHDGRPLAEAVRQIGASTGAEPAIEHRIDDLAVVAAMLEASDHVALLPRFTGARYRTAALRTRPLEASIAVARRVEVVARPDTLHRRGVRAVVDLLRVQAKALQPADAASAGPAAIAAVAAADARALRRSPAAAPFRADVVGSLLRPAAVKRARLAHASGALDGAGLRAVEDEAVAEAVARQASAGLRVATDGELRRSSWFQDFFGGLDGVALVDAPERFKISELARANRVLRVDGRIGFPADHAMLDDFRFLAAEASGAGLTAKMTIPSPAMLHFRLDRAEVLTDRYDDQEELFDDLAAAYRDALAAFYDAGCRYLQFDDTTWTYLGARKELERAAARGIRTDGLAERYARLISDVLAGKPDDLAVTTHVCGGNFRSAWITTGEYEPIAEQLLGGTPYDGYFLEFDADRQGAFDALRHLPASSGATVVLGLLDPKDGGLEDPELLAARIDEAAAIAGRDRLALSTRCGFASTEDGHALTEEQQWAKLREVVDVASRVWG